MNPKLAAVLALAVLASIPVASASVDLDAAQIDCSGSPTGIPAVVFAYQLTCALVVFTCDLVFTACPLE